MEGGGCRVEDGGWRVEGGGWRVEGGGLRVECGGLRVEGGGWRAEGGGGRLEGGGRRVESEGRRSFTLLYQHSLQAKHGYRLLRILIFKRCFVTCDCAAFWALILALALALVRVLVCQLNVAVDANPAAASWCSIAAQKRDCFMGP
jgi:hypothetical protein